MRSKYRILLLLTWKPVIQVTRQTVNRNYGNAWKMKLQAVIMSPSPQGGQRSIDCQNL